MRTKSKSKNSRWTEFFTFQTVAFQHITFQTVALSIATYNRDLYRYSVKYGQENSTNTFEIHDYIAIIFTIFGIILTTKRAWLKEKFPASNCLSRPNIRKSQATTAGLRAYFTHDISALAVQCGHDIWGSFYTSHSKCWKCVKNTELMSKIAITCKRWKIICCKGGNK